MDYTTFLDQYLTSTTLLREETIRQLLKDHAAYQEVCSMESEAEALYLQLDLTEQQRKAVDTFIMRKEQSYLYYADAAYLAGIKNVLQLRQALQID